MAIFENKSTALPSLHYNTATTSGHCYDDNNDDDDDDNGNSSVDIVVIA